MKEQYIGLSNGKEYPVFKIDKNNKNIGLTKLECMSGTCWCTFESIITNEKV